MQISNSGIYLLEIYQSKKENIDHKSFREYNFETGFYYYVGSAQKNLISRIERHQSKKKKIFWHIDYLTTSVNSKITKVFIYNYAEKNFECRLIAKIIREFKVISPIPKFGNSDCNSCLSHLLYSKKKINHSQLLALYHSTVSLIPSSNEIC